MLNTQVSEGSQALECGIAPRAGLLSATTAHWQKRNGHYTEIAYQLRGSVQGGLGAQLAAGTQPGAAHILTGNLAARRISKWELKGIHISATHCKEKCQTTAETKPKEEQLKDQPENSLKPCQKSLLTTEQVRTAAVAKAAANTHSTLEGRDSSFSPAPEGTSSAQISADKARKAKQHQIPYWPRPREATDITTTTERPLQSTASSSGPGKGCQTRFFHSPRRAVPFLSQ